MANLETRLKVAQVKISSAAGAQIKKTEIVPPPPPPAHIRKKNCWRKSDDGETQYLHIFLTAITPLPPENRESFYAAIASWSEYICFCNNIINRSYVAITTKIPAKLRCENTIRPFKI